MPENLPTPDRSIREIEREEARRLQQDSRSKRQPARFAPEDGDGELE